MTKRVFYEQAALFMIQIVGNRIRNSGLGKSTATLPKTNDWKILNAQYFSSDSFHFGPSLRSIFLVRSLHIYPSGPSLSLFFLLALEGVHTYMFHFLDFFVSPLFYTLPHRGIYDFVGPRPFGAYSFSWCWRF